MTSTQNNFFKQILFTFHYGSILIWCLPIWNSPVVIYIPLWFYSNESPLRIFHKEIFIYIPLWFYSNICLVLSFPASRRFTFHYGSILIASFPVSIKSLVIYIPLWFYSNITRESYLHIVNNIYIPLWFYSNE